MNITKLIIEDVRCFAGRQEFDIRPLTFLVGENSTGKTTILGCFDTLLHFSMIKDFFTERANLDFNASPYQMGMFADIVRKSAPEKNSFKLGCEFEHEGIDYEYILTLGEKKKGSEPVILGQKLSGYDSEIILLGEPKKGMQEYMMIYFSEIGGKKKFRISVSRALKDIATINIFDALGVANSWIRRKKRNKVLSPDEKKFQQSMGNIQQKSMDMEKIYSFAPIRSNPRRTYDPLNEVVSSDGVDVPTMLRNMSRKDPEKWQQLKKQLVAFGQSSELFTDIDVRNLGESMGDPFQLQFKVRKQKGNRNMTDIGYGVSQILPILARLLSARNSVSFLMQQPEVHLHPKAQAELSSLLANLMKHHHHHFIIETHSDAMIDRARIEIMKGNISPEDVSLIYLEPSDDSVDVHNITFDAQANFLGAPNGYRDFFLRESDRLLGFTED